MKHASRALVAVALLVGFYVLAIGIAVGVVAFVVEAINVGASGAAAGKLGFVALVVVVAIVRGLFVRSKRDGDPGGVLLTDQVEPGLWAEVRSMADVVGTRPPDEIRLIGAVNAAVAEDSKLLGLVPGTRRMFIGVPLLIALSRDQMRSVLAHELGHYSGRHTALGPITYRGKEAIGRVRANLGKDSIIGKVMGAYERLYKAVSFKVSRQQELEADEYSAQIAGRDAAASALAELAPIDAAWQHFLRDYSGMGRDQGLRPAHLFDGFASVLGDPSIREQMDRIRDEAPEPPRSFEDTHPPTSQRVAALRSADAPDVVPGSDPAASALTLLGDPAAALALVEGVIYEGDDRTPTEWADLDRAQLTANGAAGAGHLGRLLREKNLAPTLRTVVGLLDTPGPTGLLDDVDDVDRDRAIVASMLADAVSGRVVSSGHGSFRLSWGSQSPLVDAAGESLPIWQAARIEPGGAADLLALLSRHGVDVDAELAESAPQVERPAITTAEEDEVLGIALVTQGRAATLLFVTHRELVLRRNGAAERWTAVKRSVIRDGEQQVLRAADSRSVADVEADPRSTVIPFDDVTSLSIVSPRKASIAAGGIKILTLTITRRDGSTTALKVHPEVKTVGEPFAALGHYLDERYSFVDEAEPAPARS